MKKFLVAIMFGLMAIAAQAEATFEQIEGLIQQQQYSAAAQGLEVIIQNHPKSAKAFYAMAQAQAGLGNLEKARKALDIATGLNPTLDFAPSSSVASLRQAITPQVSKIESIEESHFWRNTIMALILASAIGFVFMLWRKKEDEAEAKRQEAKAELEAERARERERMRQERVAREAKEEAAREALRKHPNYGNDRFDPKNPDVLLPKKTKAQLKAEADALALREAQARAERAEADARTARSYSAPQPTTTVVQSGGGVGDFATGMILGNMMSHHSHDTTRVVEREVVREVPSKSSSWDDAPTPSRSSRSSSWDDTPSKSSSWDDDSSSKSSSSWSSSSSDSSSSWSSSSDSSSSSSSSWD